MDTKSPVLLIAWRRPESTRNVISSISDYAPNKLYVACDGPLKNNNIEAEKVRLTRKIIKENITWNCELKTLYSKENLGCKEGVNHAINWFFEHEEEGIILEDDCLPHPDFFYYCSELLKYYRSDTRIWSISGSNFQEGNSRGNYSYYFSKYFLCWGWATWKRCWINNDKDLLKLKLLKDSGLMQSIFNTKKEQLYWEIKWNKLYEYSEPDTWDYQWGFTCMINRGLIIIPNKNLIENIGFGKDDATHTVNGKSPTSKISNFKFNSSNLLPLNHPKLILISDEADRFFKNKYLFGPSRLTITWVKNQIKRIHNYIYRFIVKS